MPRFATIGDIVNRTAVSVGLDPVTDPFASDDPALIQLRTLANEVGDTLVMTEDVQWQQLEKSASFITAPGDTGIYDLPVDFGYMIDQTQWQQGAPGAAYPLLGPASAQWWSYLQASAIYSVTIYAWFQVSMGKLELWPQPPPVGIPIAYKYISRYWVQDGATLPPAVVYKDQVQQASDIVLFEPILFIKLLKQAFLMAKGFDTTKVDAEVLAAMSGVGGRDKPSPVLSLNGPRAFSPRLLDSIVNVPETGIGS